MNFKRSPEFDTNFIGYTSSSSISDNQYEYQGWISEPTFTYSSELANLYTNSSEYTKWLRKYRNNNSNFATMQMAKISGSFITEKITSNQLNFMDALIQQSYSQIYVQLKIVKF